MKNLITDWIDRLFGNHDDEIDLTDIMNRALDISGNHVMCLDLRRNLVYDLHGKALFGANVSIEQCYTFIHEEDRPAFQNFIERLSRGIDREGECRYRWDYNYTGSGEPEWHNMHSYGIAEYDDDGVTPVSIIATLTDETETTQREQRQKEMSEQYRMVFEHSVVGLSFYSPDGWLLDANDIMREICHFDSAEGDEFFSGANLFDTPPFNELLRRDDPQECWFCSESVIPEKNIRSYLEIRLHPIRDDRGRVVYISITARDVTAERNMYLQVKQNDTQLQQANKSIQVLEAELQYMMASCNMQAWRISLDRNILEFYSGLNTVVRSFSLEQLQKLFYSQEDEFVRALSEPEKALDHPLFYIGRMQPVVTLQKSEPQWVQINCIPEFDSHGRLKGAFGVWRNIMDLMEKQEQLKRETERANESGHMKSVFLANMTHEIRTPLNAIVGFTDVLPNIDQPEEKREITRIIHNNCDMLLRLINDMLTLSNADTNAMLIQPEMVDFPAFFDDICQSLAQRVSDTEVQFVKDNPCQHLTVNVDKNRLQQVITNFVTNSVKNTTQGHIRVGYRPEQRGGQDGIYVYCEDTGSGIPEEQRGRIFERFIKLNEYVQGTGLGLSICKAIIDRCGGQIGVDSTVGKGSTFWFWVPA